MTTTIFRARRIVTMTDDAPEAFATEGESIAATGTVAALRERYPGAEVVDFGDAVIVPGFNDAHAHLAVAAEDMLHLDLSIDAVSSLAEIVAAAARRAGATPPGGWIRGSRYDDAKMAEGRVLTRWDLDAVSRDHPIMVLQVAGHWGVVNSKALELGGIDESTEDPAGRPVGPRRGRPAQRHPVRDGDLRLRLPAGDAAAADDRAGQHAGGPSARLAARDAGVSSAGITSVTDAMCGPDDIALFRRAAQRRAHDARHMLLHFEHYGLLAQREIRTGSATGACGWAGSKRSSTARSAAAPA